MHSAETWTCLTFFKRSYSQWRTRRVKSVEETLPKLCMLKEWHYKVLEKKKTCHFFRVHLTPDCQLRMFVT